LAEEEYALFGLNETTLSKHKFSLRRSHLEIRMDILSCVRSGAERPTQIMYRANLSWTSLKEHLAVLEKGKLLVPVEQGARTRYEMTDKAMTLLMAYCKIIEEVSTPVQKTETRF